ncbi:hypothetical protein HK101_009573 [Irineochytrium annulatum]|nr:hypothetical protein HK101_009573 [Irineochytrium annulatum]
MLASAVTVFLSLALAVNGQSTTAPAATLATTVAAATTTLGGSLTVGGIDVTAIFKALTPCTQGCLAGAGVNVDSLTLQVLAQACANPNALVSGLQSCMQKNNCNNANDQSQVAALSTECSLLKTFLPSSNTTAAPASTVMTTSTKSGTALASGISTVGTSTAGAVRGARVGEVQVAMGLLSVAVLFAAV